MFVLTWVYNQIGCKKEYQQLLEMIWLFSVMIIKLAIPVEG